MTLEEYHPKSEKFSSHEDWQKFLIIHFNEDNTCSLVDTKYGLRIGLLTKIENDPKIVKYIDAKDVEYIAEVWDTAKTRKEANEILTRATVFCLNEERKKAENDENEKSFSLVMKTIDYNPTDSEVTSTENESVSEISHSGSKSIIDTSKEVQEKNNVVDKSRGTDTDFELTSTDATVAIPSTTDDSEVTSTENESVSEISHSGSKSMIDTSKEVQEKNNDDENMETETSSTESTAESTKEEPKKESMPIETTEDRGSEITETDTKYLEIADEFYPEVNENNTPDSVTEVTTANASPSESDYDASRSKSITDLQSTCNSNNGASRPALTLRPVRLKYFQSL